MPIGRIRDRDYHLGLASNNPQLTNLLYSDVSQISSTMPQSMSSHAESISAFSPLQFLTYQSKQLIPSPSLPPNKTNKDFKYLRDRKPYLKFPYTYISQAPSPPHCLPYSQLSCNGLRWWCRLVSLLRAAMAGSLHGTRETTSQEREQKGQREREWEG